MSTRRTSASGLVGAACLLALASGSGNAAVTTVYKCFDRSLGVLYTDQPCRGEQLAIEGGSVDPVAIAELHREREALSRAVAQRVADNRRAVLDRDYAPTFVYAGPQGDGNETYYPAYSPAPYATYAPYATDRRPRPDARPNVRRERAPSVPAPPGNLIRR